MSNSHNNKSLNEKLLISKRKSEAKTGIPYDEYIRQLPEIKRYRKKVWLITKQCASKLKNYDKRGHYNNGGWQIDHIVPIIYGYRHKISERLIGSIDNLRMIPGLDNLKKHSTLTNDSINILKGWGYIV